MALIIVLIIIGLFIYFRKKRKTNSNYRPNAENFQSKFSNLPFPDRTDAIVLHINNIEKGLKEKDFNLANMSYAKLTESIRQQNINQNGALDEQLKIIQNEYLTFRNVYNLEYPPQFLPPSQRSKYSDSKESHEIVNVSSVSNGHNSTELTFELDEEELLKRIVNGTLTEGNNETDIEDITGFYGSTKYSPNQEFCVAYCEGYENNGRWKNGELALVNKKSLLFKKKMPRPNDCHVSNNGIVVCCDWLNSGELTGKFLVFNSEGKQLFSKKTSANLGSCGISDDGKVAVFETYHSKTEDSDSFFIVDVETNKIINKFETLISFNNVIINTQSKSIKLINHKKFVFEIDFEGNQINVEEYENQIMTMGSIVDKLELYLSKTGDMRFGDSNFLELLYKALSDDNASYAYGKDRLYRMIGEYYEANNDVDKTIENWEKAVEINPKVGIKKRLDSLKGKRGKFS